MRILIADDSADTAACLGELMRAADHEVRLAANGLQAVEISRVWRPRAAILDLHMPVMDGLLAAKALRSADAEVALVALTGRTDPAVRLEIRAAGFDVHFSKLVDFEVMRVAIERLVAHWDRSTGEAR